MEEAERFAGGLTTSDAINESRGRFYAYALSASPQEQRDWVRHRFAEYTLVRQTTYSDEMVRTVSQNSNWLVGVAPYHPEFPPILRDIFGNPFRPASADPRWITLIVAGLAEAIYADRAFDRLPILADALEEAGSDDAKLLVHCRGPGPHARGCWPVD